MSGENRWWSGRGGAHPNRYLGWKSGMRKTQNTGLEGSGGDGVLNVVEASGC